MFYAEEVVEFGEEQPGADFARMKQLSRAGLQQVDYWTGDMGDEEADDEDLKQMDGQKPEKSRYDFATEEEYEKYKASQQNLPKAAFQFGVKKGDGRLSQKEMSKKVDAKISADMGKIRNLMKARCRGSSSARSEGQRFPGNPAGTVSPPFSLPPGKVWGQGRRGLRGQEDKQGQGGRSSAAGWIRDRPS